MLIVGLGNPGPQHARQRHNLGFMLVDRLAERWQVGSFRQKFSAEWAKASVFGREVVLLKPQTFMNRSGESVQPALAFFKVGLPQLLVLHDELDLPWASLRWKQGGGIAGHNGLRSIVQRCASQDFLRLRLGIDKPGQGEAIGHVLGDLSTGERQTLPDMLERAALGIECWLQEGLPAAMRQLHTDHRS